ncbi:MAG: type 1 glutamine amidotransferase domain-containing protein [Gammaproteobacteria bacterium]|nr:type 1 glutamine amidotransferase domain-containing protein [Gammaproteobacteria bacterium]MBU1775823.1 type 1 glutamine amidotransferase domain-containing protein [Gammaproteobacteria bacterium]MBU1969599.1 type 1 glutamine amidotransferase domain-containing protein [Gammaproteobacteria bacterium]
MKSSKRILAVMSEWGYWGIELVGPMSKLVAAGYEFDFATPKGKRAPVLPPSIDTTYRDPALDACVTTQEDAALVLAFEKTSQLDKTLNLSAMFPERPYFSHPGFLREYEAYHEKRRIAQEKAVAEYDAILLVGGSGPIVDIVNNQRVHDLVLAFHAADKPIAAICYGVATLVFARDFNERKSIIADKHVTGHCIEYDHHDGTGFVGTDFNMGPPPYVLEYILADAVGPGGQYHGNFGKRTSVIVDFPFITARSLQCSHEFGEKILEVLDEGLRRYGW